MYNIAPVNIKKPPKKSTLSDALLADSGSLLDWEEEDRREKSFHERNINAGLTSVNTITFAHIAANSITTSRISSNATFFGIPIYVSKDLNSSEIVKIEKPSLNSEKLLGFWGKFGEKTSKKSLFELINNVDFDGIGDLFSKWGIIRGISNETSVNSSQRWKINLMLNPDSSTHSLIEFLDSFKEFRIVGFTINRDMEPVYSWLGPNPIGFSQRGGSTATIEIEMFPRP